MHSILKDLALDKLLQKGIFCGTRGKTWYPVNEASPLSSYSPIDNSEIGKISTTSKHDYEKIVNESCEVLLRWRALPAPKRGEVIRQIAFALREKKDLLGKLVSLETGKILAEGLGEIQEAIDIADFAVGLSRQLYGKTMHSERPVHRMYEQWHPLGVIGVITAFNFPAAVWAWNAMLAAVCGNTVIWKPSEQTPLTAFAMTEICEAIAEKHGFPGLFSLVIDSSPELGKVMAADVRLPLISATGSCIMGRAVAEVVGKRLGRSLLELGGNNAIVVLEDANLNLVIPSVVFGAVGTAGQRCTSTRRLLVQSSIVDSVLERLVKAYKQVKIGDPLKAGTLMGPLINERAVASYSHALKAAKAQGAEVVYGGDVLTDMPSKLYVTPTIVKARREMTIVHEETFAPILYVIPIKDISEAIAVNNEVPQGLSSAIFTQNLQSAEKFLGVSGSDCGIANVNIGTSGAEIGGAFGGEKDTGGGRESGSDSWQQYMRRQTCTINYSNDLPLAQGIKFSVE